MGLLAYMLVALLAIVALAVAYDLRARRSNRGLSDELREGSQENARRDARTRPDNRGTTDPFNGGGGFSPGP